MEEILHRTQVQHYQAPTNRWTNIGHESHTWQSHSMYQQQPSQAMGHNFSIGWICLQQHEEHVHKENSFWNRLFDTSKIDSTRLFFVDIFSTLTLSLWHILRWSEILHLHTSSFPERFGFLHRCSYSWLKLRLPTNAPLSASPNLDWVYIGSFQTLWDLTLSLGCVLLWD